MPRRLSGIHLLLFGMFCCVSQAPPGESGHLHVLVQRLPQCDYGVGYERPLRVDLLRGSEVVATTYHSGVYLGEESLRVALHVPEAYPGRYVLRFGRCPSLVEDPLGAVECEPVDWVRRTRLRLQPRGINEPHVVEYHRVRARCLSWNPPAPE